MGYAASRCGLLSQVVSFAHVTQALASATTLHWQVHVMRTLTAGAVRSEACHQVKHIHTRPFQLPPQGAVSLQN